MAHLGLDIFDILSLVDEQAGIGMPKVVKPDPGQTRRLQSRQEVPLNHVAVVYRFLRLIRENQITFVLGAGKLPLS